MKRLYALFICGILMLWLSGCTINAPNPLTGSIEDEEPLVFEFNVSVVDTSAYLTDAGMRFSVSFISEDESVGLVIQSKNLYWSIVDEVSIEGKNLYEAKVGVSGSTITYFELDGISYVGTPDNDLFLSSSRWYDISEYRKVVDEE